MKTKRLFLAVISALLLSYCTRDRQEAPVWVKPSEPGNPVILGDELQLRVRAASEPDSIVYFIDDIRVATGTDVVNVPTSGLKLGNRMITARIYTNDQPGETSTNIVLTSGLVPKKYSYQVVRTFSHDTSSYTQGLEYYNGFLYESDGVYEESSLRKTTIDGKVVQQTDITDPRIFAEGIVILGEKILQLTYQENLMIEYDLKTLKQLRQFPAQNPREGWGLCTDGKVIYNTDGTNAIYLLDRETYRQTGLIEVFDQNGPVSSLNELEFIDGKIFANIYQTDRIVIIDPKTGQVTGEIDLSGLYPLAQRNRNADVLNGIAWDAKGRRLFVTGKKWDKLFEIKLSEN